MLTIEVVNGFEVGLDPAVKTFITVSLILGPLCIFALTLLLKKIEADDPGRIRWK